MGFGIDIGQLKRLRRDFGAYFARESLNWRLEGDRGELRSSRKCADLVENGVTRSVCLVESFPTRRDDEELIPPLQVVVLLATALCTAE